MLIAVLPLLHINNVGQLPTSAVGDTRAGGPFLDPLLEIYIVK